MTPAQYEQWKKDLSNWGRWGKDDEIGALNLITPAKRKQAAALVQGRRSVSLARDPDTEKAVDNPNPYEHHDAGHRRGPDGASPTTASRTRISTRSRTSTTTASSTTATSRIADEVVKANRHFKNSIHNLKNGIFTRGVLIDIPRLKGVPYLEPGTPIYVEDLEAWEKQAGVKVGPGDALFVRTGVWARRKALGPYCARPERRRTRASIRR